MTNQYHFSGCFLHGVTDRFNIISQADSPAIDIVGPVCRKVHNNHVGIFARSFRTKPRRFHRPGSMYQYMGGISFLSSSRAFNTNSAALAPEFICWPVIRFPSRTANDSNICATWNFEWGIFLASSSILKGWIFFLHTHPHNSLRCWRNRSNVYLQPEIFHLVVWHRAAHMYHDKSRP